MVALLVAIAVVFVSSPFFQSSLTLTLTLTLTFTYPPPTHTRIYKQTSHTDYLSLYLSRYYQTVVVNAVMALLR